MLTSKSCLPQLCVGVALLDPGVFYQIDAGALMDGVEVSVTNVCRPTQELHEYNIKTVIGDIVICIAARCGFFTFCPNGGTCVRPDVCACAAGWTGSRCTQGIF